MLKWRNTTVPGVPIITGALGLALKTQGKDIRTIRYIETFTVTM